MNSLHAAFWPSIGPCFEFFALVEVVRVGDPIPRQKQIQCRVVKSAQEVVPLDEPERVRSSQSKHRVGVSSHFGGYP